MRVLLIATLLLFAGCVTPADTQHSHASNDSHSHDMPGTDHAMDGPGGRSMDHMHAVYDVPADEPQPSVDLEVRPDPKMGWNVHIVTTNWTFAPLSVSGNHTPGEGHAHWYVDGVKMGRIYTEWFHVKSGSELRVTLNSNTHADLAIDGELLEATATLEPIEPAEGHGHGMGHEISSPASVTITNLMEDPKTVDGDKHNLILTVETTGFTFAPQNASTMHQEGEGHAHVYLDGVKLGRLYGNGYHIGGLSNGTHEVRVELNGNDHAPIMMDGAPVETVSFITV